MSSFYRNWLNLWAWGVFAFGAAIALFVFPATEGPMRVFFEILGHPIPIEPDGHFRFAMGLMGCISMGWGLTYLVVFKAAHHLPAAAATQFWRGITMAAGFWFVTDSFASIYTGYWINAVSNSVLAVLYMIPVLASGVLRSNGHGYAASPLPRP